MSLSAEVIIYESISGLSVPRIKGDNDPRMAAGVVAMTAIMTAVMMAVVMLMTVISASSEAAVEELRRLLLLLLGCAVQVSSNTRTRACGTPRRTEAQVVEPSRRFQEGRWLLPTTSGGVLGQDAEQQAVSSLYEWLLFLILLSVCECECVPANTHRFERTKETIKAVLGTLLCFPAAVQPGSLSKRHFCPWSVVVC